MTSRPSRGSSTVQGKYSFKASQSCVRAKYDMGSTDLDDTESDFYGKASRLLFAVLWLMWQGDEETVSRLNARVANFNAGKWLRKHSVAATQATAKSRAPVLPISKLHNPYAGVSYAWQLTETVEQFLKRLPPEATQATPECPWIFICNPHVSRKAKYAAQNQGRRGNEDECPEEDGTQLARLIEGGSERLHYLRTFVDKVRKTDRAQNSISREVNKEKQRAVEDILRLAGLCKVRAGKEGFQLPIALLPG